MSKVICEFCGTSYSDTATQCPICGCVRPADDQSIMNVLEEAKPEREYHHVRGGRFSKSNVRKRNMNANSGPVPVNNNPDSDDKQEPSNRGLIITIIVLLLAIAAVIVYIAFSFFGIGSWFSGSVEYTKPEIHTTESTEDLSCKEIRLESEEIVLEEIGSSVKLAPVLTPVNTKDLCTFFTDNDTVATVTADGTVTAISSGEAMITVTCGDVSVICKVVVPEPDVPFALTCTEISFTEPGEQCLLYDGKVALEKIVWATDDENVAIVQNATVVAVGNGITTIYANYNGETASCIVWCDFSDATEASTDQTFVDNGPYQLKNAYGFSNTDATIRVGESFVLILIDKDGNKVDGVAWSVSDGSCCTVDNGTVTGVSSGKANVVATFNGESYTCVVRVS